MNRLEKRQLKPHWLQRRRKLMGLMNGIDDFGLPEAPLTDGPWGRFEGQWVEVPPEAPKDGTHYGRVSDMWQPVTGEAPNDGLIYGRQNHTWVPAAGGGGGLDLATGDARYVNVDGDKMTGDLIIEEPDPYLTLNITSPSGYALFNSKYNGVYRWSLFVGNPPADASRWGLNRFADDGTYIGTAFAFERFTGVMTLDCTVPSTSATTGALVVAGGIGSGGRITSGGEIWNSSSANTTHVPRLTVYKDGVNFAFFSYLTNANAYFSFGNTTQGAPFHIGTCSAQDGTGVFTKSISIGGANIVSDSFMGGTLTVDGGVGINGRLLQGNGVAGIGNFNMASGYPPINNGVAFGMNFTSAWREANLFNTDIAATGTAGGFTFRQLTSASSQRVLLDLQGDAGATFGADVNPTGVFYGTSTRVVSNQSPDVEHGIAVFEVMGQSSDVFPVGQFVFSNKLNPLADKRIASLSASFAADASSGRLELTTCNSGGVWNPPVTVLAGGGSLRVGSVAIATSPTTGSLQTLGGLGVSGSIYTGGGISFKNGTNLNEPFAIYRATGVELLVISGGPGGIQFNNDVNSVALMNISNAGVVGIPVSASIAQLAVGGNQTIGGELSVYGGIIRFSTDVTKYLYWTGTALIANFPYLSFNGYLNINDGTQSTHYTTGSITTLGGIGAAGNIHTNGLIYATGDITAGQNVYAGAGMQCHSSFGYKSPYGSALEVGYGISADATTVYHDHKGDRHVYRAGGANQAGWSYHFMTVEGNGGKVTHHTHLQIGDDYAGSALFVGSLGHTIGRRAADGSMMIGGGQNAVRISPSNSLVVENNSATSSSTSGALVVVGGLGVAQDIRCGSSLICTYDVYCRNVYMSGAMSFSGGLSVGNGISSGLYGDTSNVAIRTYGVNSGIYFQEAGGAFNMGNINRNGMAINAVTPSTSTGTGALVVGGGVGVQGAVHSQTLRIAGEMHPSFSSAKAHITFNSTVEQGMAIYQFEGADSQNGGYVTFMGSGQAVNGAIRPAGPWGVVYQSSSDIRGKKNRERLDLNRARQIIDDLEIYDYDKEGNLIRGIGLIAQQAYEVHKSLAWKPPEDKPEQFWMTEKAAPMPFVIANLQLLNEEIAALKRQLKTRS